VKLAGGVPFISDADLESALKDAHVTPRVTDDTMAAYQEARITGLKAGLAILALMTILALALSRAIPKTQQRKSHDRRAAAAQKALTVRTATFLGIAR
jgi:hypothetical protein